MKNCKLKLIAAAVMMSLGTMGAAQAADTTSTMRGKITGPEGQAAANVKIKVTHQPSGTVTEYVTNGSGVFLARGLRVGGPYTVVVDSDEYADETKNNIFLQLGDTYRLKTKLESVNVERIAISASRITETNGASSIYGANMISRMPSLNNDLKDIARMNPMVTIRGNGEMTIAGGNPRTNSITLDGIGLNDDFGLNKGGYPTERSPISLDTIEQISVDAAPFSVRKGGFSGGTIDAVTKSGTNEFAGTTYYEFTNPNYAGDIVTNFRISGAENDDGNNGFRQFTDGSADSITDETTYAITFGGPIIKDKLFFFTNYEQYDKTLEMDYGFNDLNAAHSYNTSEENFNEFLRILNDVYGLTDSLGGNPKDKDQKWLMKLDWNISDDHRMNFMYSGNKTSAENNQGSGGNTVRLNSARYFTETTMDNFTTKFFSDWTDNFSTEMGANFKNVRADHITNSQLGSIRVDEFFLGPSYQFGADEFRHANESETDTLNVFFNGDYLMGEHNINFGIDIQRMSLYNLFAENSRGSFEFDDFAGFESGTIGNFGGNYDFSYANAYTNNAADTAYTATRTTSTVYLQDTFYLNDDIEINAGFRYERLSSDDKPTLNANFVDTYGYDNQQNLDGLAVFMPRVSFKWFVADELTLRGGLGRFSGGVPNVWYNGPFTKDGITLVAAPESVINDYFANLDTPVDITSIPQAIQDSMQAGAGSTNYTDPNFKLPSDWRLQLAADWVIGDGYAWTNEIMYAKTQNEAVWFDTSLTPLDENGSLNYAADGVRLIQSSIYDGDKAQNFDIMMTNSDLDGKKLIFTTSLTKEWDNGISVSTSYTNQDIEESQPGSSSRNQSNYKHNIGINRNQVMSTTGHYEQKHTFKLTFGYNTELFEGYNTQINMYFERSTGRPFSWTMSSFRDGDLGDNEEFYNNSAYLAYIPSGPDDVNVDWDSSVGWDELSLVLDSAGVKACGCI
ncbi:MAG: TonB-dependent receptor, partial [Psychrosphaera sp.]|nr:TonB-dependent receptor [Psychrosphaera sp.]